jgi:hypothetical protein
MEKYSYIFLTYLIIYSWVMSRGDGDWSQDVIHLNWRVCISILVTHFQPCIILNEQYDELPSHAAHLNIARLKNYSRARMSQQDKIWNSAEEWSARKRCCHVLCAMNSKIWMFIHWMPCRKYSRWSLEFLCMCSHVWLIMEIVLPTRLIN